jgi:hypothetical protein
MKAAIIALLVVVSGFASAAYGQTASPVEQLQNQAVFCEGTYALCIKAACNPIPTIDRLGNYTYDRASCSCGIENGWSMGPGQCSERTPVRQGHLVYMILTYSNLFNKTNATLSCPNQDTQWAWCYGAPCVANERDVKEGKGAATCTCPLQTGPMQTLGGSCAKDSCTSIWSAATPGGDNGANKIFADYMQAHGYPHNGSAQMCASQNSAPQNSTPR